MRRALLFGVLVTLTEVQTPTGPALVLAPDDIVRDTKPDFDALMDRLPPPSVSMDIPRAKKKCDRCHRWTGGASHYCKRGWR